MRFLLGVAAGIAATWAALAIWQRMPEFLQLEPDSDPDVSDGLRGRPGYLASVAGAHDQGCRWPDRPCLCSLNRRGTR